LTYRAAGKVLGVRARDCRGEIPGGDRGGALRGGAEEGEGADVRGRLVSGGEGGRALGWRARWARGEAGWASGANWAEGVWAARGEALALSACWAALGRPGGKVLGGPRAGLGRTGEGGEWVGFWVSGWAGFSIFSFYFFSISKPKQTKFEFKQI
jgi:hypothetical protein